jgi:rhamnose transport system substrate-binding protein
MRITRVWNRCVSSRTLATCLVLGLAAALATSAAARPTVATKGHSIEFIEVEAGIPYYLPLIEGFSSEAAKLGDSFSVVGPADTGASSQIPFIQQATVQHIQGIAIQPNDPAAPLPALKQAAAAGAKILETNVESLPASLKVASVTALNYNLVAPAQLAELGKLMNYTGDFAILSAATTSVFQNQQIAIMKKLLKSNSKYRNMHLVKVAYGNDQSVASTTATNALLTEFPNLKAITSPTTVGIAAAAQAIESAHKQGKIILSGLGLPSQMRKYVLDGTVTEFQLWDPKSMGIVSAYVLDKAIGGEKFPAGKTFTIPGSNLGTLKVAAGGGIYAQNGVTTFTKANINQYDF